MKNLLRLIVLTVLLIFAVSVAVAQDDVSGTPADICSTATPAEDPESRNFVSPEDVLEEGVDYRAVFCTDAGAIYIDLLEDYAPQTVNNFVFLAENDYYNNTIFHRVLEDFMAQGGDPTGTGSGGPGYQFSDEFAGFLTFDRPGLLAMANAGAGTNGSQFFITTVPTPHLNYRHTIFGDVLEGQDNVMNILLRDPSVADAPATLLETVVIITDPSNVESDYQNPLQTASAEEIVAGLSGIGAEGALPPDLVDGFVPAEVIATEDLPEAFADKGHEFRIPVSVNNLVCSEQYFFEALHYTIDSFESAEAVSDFMASDEFASLNDDLTGTETVLGMMVYQGEPVDGCGEDQAVMTRAYLQRGKYLVTVDALLLNSIVGRIGSDELAGLLVNTLPQIFEAGLTDVYRAELP